MTINKIFIHRDSHAIITIALLKCNIITFPCSVNIYVEEGKLSPESLLFLSRLSSKKLNYFSVRKWSYINSFQFILFGLIKLVLVFSFRFKDTSLTFHDMNTFFLYKGYLSNYILIEEGKGFYWYQKNHRILSFFSFCLSRLYGGKLANSIFRFTKKNLSSKDIFLGEWGDWLNFGHSFYDNNMSNVTLLNNIDFIWLHQCPIDCCRINSMLIDFFSRIRFKPMIKLHPSSCDCCVELFRNSDLEIWNIGTMPLECYNIDVPVFSFFSTYRNSSILKYEQYSGDTIVISDNDLLSLVENKLDEYFTE